MSFGGNLRALLEERELTQKEVARRLNIAPSTMGSYVQNVREPDFATLKLLADFFDVTTDYLLDHDPGRADTPQERELLRIFRSLTAEQRQVCVEQCRVFVRLNHREKECREKSCS